MTLALKIVAAAVVSLLCGPTLARDATLITDVTIVDLESGILTAGQSVLIEGGLIA